MFVFSSFMVYIYIYIYIYIYTVLNFLQYLANVRAFFKVASINSGWLHCLVDQLSSKLSIEAPDGGQITC